MSITLEKIADLEAKEIDIMRAEQIFKDAKQKFICDAIKLLYKIYDTVNPEHNVNSNCLYLFNFILKQSGIDSVYSNPSLYLFSNNVREQNDENKISWDFNPRVMVENEKHYLYFSLFMKCDYDGEDAYYGSYLLPVSWFDMMYQDEALLDFTLKQQVKLFNDSVAKEKKEYEEKVASDKEFRKEQLQNLLNKHNISRDEFNKMVELNKGE